MISSTPGGYYCFVITGEIRGQIDGRGPMTVATAVVAAPRRVAGWAGRRALARNSLTGIELGCALCAAVWFSAGTRMTALAGGAALAAGCLARPISRMVDTSRFGDWLAGVGGLAGELAVYAALAVGAGGHRRDWGLATAAAALLGTQAVVQRCRPGMAGKRWPWARRRSRPVMESAELAGAERAGADRAGAERAGAERAGAEPPGSAPAGALSGLLAVPGWVRAVMVTAAAASYGAQAALVAAVWAGAIGLTWLILTASRSAGGGPWLTGCRDDGPIARFAGSVVRGQLVPLPPAVAGLFATVLLAVLGLHGLAGPVLLTPVAAMLLAAPGSAHPHNGAADWLAPALVQAGEYVYLAALGFAVGVPGPVTAGLIGLVALRQLDVAEGAVHPGAVPPARAGGWRGGLGWDGRMLVAGAGAMFGLGIISYLALAAYLAWQLAATGLAGWAATQPRPARATAV